MLSEDRVIHMTRMAIFEQKEEKNIQPMIQYSEKDYMTLAAMGSFLVGTAVYWLIYAGIVLALLSSVVINVGTFLIIIGILLGVAGYVVYLFYFHMRYALKRAKHNYREGRHLVNELRQAYKTLEEMYALEEELKAPEGWDEP